MEVLTKIAEVLGHISPVVITILVFVFETAFRFMKTEKPKSIIYLVGSAFKALGVIFTKLGEVSDKVLPQKVKAE
jgi:hypothetical protein